MNSAIVIHVPVFRVLAICVALSVSSGDSQRKGNFMGMIRAVSTFFVGPTATFPSKVIGIMALFTVATVGCRGAATLGGHTFPEELSPPVHAAKDFLEGNQQLEEIAGDHSFESASLVRVVGVQTREVRTTLVTASARGEITVIVAPSRGNGSDGSDVEWQVQQATLRWQGQDHTLNPN